MFVCILKLTTIRMSSYITFVGGWSQPATACDSLRQPELDGPKSARNNTNTPTTCRFSVPLLATDASHSWFVEFCARLLQPTDFVLRKRVPQISTYYHDRTANTRAFNYKTSVNCCDILCQCFEPRHKLSETTGYHPCQLPIFFQGLMRMDREN